MTVEDKLIKRCINKERTAQYELYKQCYESLMPIALRYERNEEDARENLNQAFLKILNNLNKYDSNIPFEAWTKRILINTIIDSYRKDKKRLEKEMPMVLNGEFEMDSFTINEAHHKLAVEDLEKMIQKLPEVNRKVFNLYVMEGYTHKEISEMLGISDGTSKWHLNSARGRLQKMLRDSIRTIKALLL